MGCRVTSQRAAGHTPDPREGVRACCHNKLSIPGVKRLASGFPAVYMRPMLPAARILDRHPLLRRLSGQAIWNLLEEEGLPEDHIAVALDRFEAAKAACVDLLSRAADPTQRAARPWVLLRRDPGLPACPGCAALHHTVLAADLPELTELIPPYGLGCALFATLAGDADLAGLTPAAAPLRREQLPGRELFCASRSLAPAGRT